MSRSCCLCLQALCSDHRKRKRVSGPSCNKAREVLTSLSGRRCVDFILHDPDAVLCTSCDNTLNSIAKCEQKLVALKTDILEKVSKAMGQGQSSSYCRKRSLPPTHSAFLPATKATRGGLTSSDSCDAPPSLPVTCASVESRAAATDYQSILSSPPTHISSDKCHLINSNVSLHVTEQQMLLQLD